MKKVMTFGLAAMAALCLTVNPVLAGDQTSDTKAPAQTSGKACPNPCTKGASAQLTSAKSGSCGAKAEGTDATKANATEASAKHACPMTADGKVDYEQCAKMMGMTPEECAAMCKDGKMEMVNMNVKGMTCGGCEKTVTTALQKVDGVHKVVSVSYADGTALVCIDPTKVKPEALTTAVTNSGYQAEVIPAVATATSADHAKMCAGEKKAGCCAAKGAKAEASKEESTGGAKPAPSAEGTK